MKHRRHFCQEIYKMLGGRCALCYLLTGFMVLLTSLGCISAVAKAIESQTDHPSTAHERICLSMRVLANEAKKEPLHKEVESLAFIGWLEGFVIDPDNRDVVLIGRRMPKWPTLDIDDLAVNMRNVWNREAHPYCSLDPRPEDLRKLNELASRAGIVTSVDQMHRFFNRLKEAWVPKAWLSEGFPGTPGMLT